MWTAPRCGACYLTQLTACCHFARSCCNGILIISTDLLNEVEKWEKNVSCRLCSSLSVVHLTVFAFIGDWLSTTVCLFVGCLTSQQHASVSQGRICTDSFTCCHTEIEAADQTFHLTQSQYTDTGPTSPSTDPITPGAWQGSHWSANV